MDYRLPLRGDNAAIATRRLEPGTRIEFEGNALAIARTVLEGHRFALRPIAAGTRLTSWGMPFGTALRDIAPGEYLCNDGILSALGGRDLDFDLPESPNFADFSAAYRLDPAGFRPGLQVPQHPQPGSFAGFARAGGRGTGTRNYIVVLGTSALAGSFARQLAARLAQEAAGVEGLDGVVAVAHTEGGGRGRPNNLEFVLRTLAGFMVHPNVGAVLALDYGSEPVNNQVLERWMHEHDYPLHAVTHRFQRITHAQGAALEECAAVLRGWFGPVAASRRTPQPIAGLKVALQCGGSDAFSGISANPLAGRVAREVIRHGGAAGLAETDELIGAEAYMLANTRDLDTARQFLRRIDLFRERAAWHGHSVEGNPTGGNKLRGLYNLAIKSIGAARKKDPDVRLDWVIDYGERMRRPGFYFMDSPGNDLESIAGQVASGCNLIFFTTGNGSITNFPFVPTLKFVTTSGRWRLLERDMDVNAGRYLDGAAFEELGAETFELALATASGRRSAGERAGHSQVSIWRDWQLNGPADLAALRRRQRPDGRPLSLHRPAAMDGQVQVFDGRRGPAAEQVGLIVPTSLCSGQIAQRIAERLSASARGAQSGLTRYVALPHTEGCGASAGENEEHQLRTLLGHLLHPCVHAALLLEHGCERTHNDLLRRTLAAHGVDAAEFGWASIQLDGGIDRVSDKVERWFRERPGPAAPAARRNAGLEAVALGLLATGPVPAVAGAALARLAASIVMRGGRVVVPEHTGLLQEAAFLDALGLNAVPASTLEYGEPAARPGLHVMAAPVRTDTEALAGLGGTGVQSMLAWIAGPPLPGNPLVPLLAAGAAGADEAADDLDCVVDVAAADSGRLAQELLERVCATHSGNYRPRLWGSGRTDFQLTRGLLGVSL